MKKILFVCTGNTCRSAMAEGLLKKKIEDRGMKDYAIDSCGIFAQNGEKATEEATFVLKEYYDVDISKHIAKNIGVVNLNECDLILCMTNSHKNILIDKYPSLEDKIYTLNEYSGKEYDIADPFGGGIDIYKDCANAINESLDLLIEKGDF